MMKQGLVGILVAAACVLGHDVAAKQQWSGYTYVGGAKQIAYEELVVMARDIEKATNGEVSIKMNPPGSLPISTQTITQAIGDNVLQFAADGFAIGNVPINGLLRLPMLFQNYDEFTKALEVVNPYLTRAYAKKGVTVLAVYIYPLQTMWSSQKLESLDDVKNQKIRVTSADQGEFIRRLGGAPLTIGAPEVPSALQTGVVQGLLTASTGGGILWKDQLAYNYRLGVNFFHSIIIVNTENFTKLPAAAQDAIRKAAQAGTRRITEGMRAQEGTVTADIAKGGLKVTEATPEQYAAATKLFADYWDVWTTKQTPEIQEAFKKIRAEIGR